MTTQQAIEAERQRYAESLGAAIDARNAGNTAEHGRRVLHAHVHFLAWQRLRHSVTTSADLDAAWSVSA